MPALHWAQRSDWINVKDPATFPAALKSEAGAQPLAAKGDGVADDTAAIQNLLDVLQMGNTL